MVLLRRGVSLAGGRVLLLWGAMMLRMRGERRGRGRWPTHVEHGRRRQVAGMVRRGWRPVAVAVAVAVMVVVLMMMVSLVLLARALRDGGPELRRALSLYRGLSGRGRGRRTAVRLVSPLLLRGG